MQRDLQEILASQQKMIENRGLAANPVPKHLLEQVARKHLISVEKWLAAQSNIQKIDINYNQLLQSPQPTLVQLNHFLGDRLNIEQMLQVIRQDPYRNRR